MNFCFLILHIAIRKHQAIFGNIFDLHVIYPLITRATNKEILVAHFRKKFPADFLFIWHIYIWTAISVNDLITFWEQIILKWLSSGHFEFELFCNIYATQNQSKIAGPCIYNKM